MTVEDRIAGAGAGPGPGPGPRHGHALAPRIGLIDVVMLGAGTAMGVSIFSVLGPAARIGGAGILVTVLIAALPMAIFSLTYALLASVLPRSGASYEWPRAIIHPFAGFAVSWLRIVSSVGSMATIGLVLTRYLPFTAALGAKPIMAGVFTLILATNLCGVQVAARAQTVAMVMLLVVLAALVAMGLPHVRLAYIGSPLAGGIAPIILSLPLMMQLFLGIETASEVGEEVRDPARTIPMALAIALALILIAYLAVTFTVLGVLGIEATGASAAPLLDASRIAWGPGASTLMAIAAIIALMKTINSVFIVFSRYLFAMGRAGVFPAALARISPGGGPTGALIAAYLFSLGGLALPANLIYLLLAVSIPTTLKYLSSCTCAAIIATSRPEMLAQSALRLPRKLILFAAFAGILSAIGLFFIGIGTDFRPYLMVAGWFVIGVGYWAWRTRTAQGRPKA